MEIGAHWKTIQAMFLEGRHGSRHFAVATVDENGSPRVAPIGALFLRDDRTGFFFDKLPVGMSGNMERNPRVCIPAVNSDRTFWQESVVLGTFATPPVVRLMGTVGEKREAAEEEINRWRERVKAAKGTKGYDLMWRDLNVVRDIRFDSFEPVFFGEMTRDLWH